METKGLSACLFLQSPCWLLLVSRKARTEPDVLVKKAKVKGVEKAFKVFFTLDRLVAPHHSVKKIIIASREMVMCHYMSRLEDRRGQRLVGEGTENVVEGHAI